MILKWDYSKKKKENKYFSFYNYRTVFFCNFTHFLHFKRKAAFFNHVVKLRCVDETTVLLLMLKYLGD